MKNKPPHIENTEEWNAYFERPENAHMRIERPTQAPHAPTPTGDKEYPYTSKLHTSSDPAECACSLSFDTYSQVLRTQLRKLQTTEWSGDPDIYDGTTMDGRRFEEWHTNITVKKAGNRYTLTKFEKPVRIRSMKDHHKKARTYVRTNEKRKDNLQRAKTRIEDLVHTNWPTQPERYKAPVYIVLTYKDTDLAQPENRHIHLQHQRDFIRGLRKRFGKDIKYVSTLELQNKNNRNAVHFNICVFNLPYHEMHQIIELWPHSSPEQVFMRRQKTGYKGGKKNAQALTRYMNKLIRYMDKDLSEVAGYYEKTYLPSQGLKQPSKYTRPDTVKPILEMLENEKEWERQWTSSPRYIPYFEAWCAIQLFEPREYV